MDIMKIYRLETKNGGGIYRCEDEPTIFHDALFEFSNEYPDMDVPFHSDIPNHPLPCQDVLFCFHYWEKYSYDITNFDWEIPDKNIQKYCFGFSDLSQFKNWIDHRGLLKFLESRGVIMVTYEIQKEHVIIGDSQSAFVYNEANIVHKDGNLKTYWI